MTAQNNSYSGDSIERFIIESLDIRGARVCLHLVWQALQERRHYPPTVSTTLGEMAAVSCIITGNLKENGRLGFQIHGQGTLNLLVIDCTAELNLRAYAKFSPDIQPAPLTEQIGEGYLMLSLDAPEMKTPYQSFVPLEGGNITAIFSHYLTQSEQQPAWLMVYANSTHAGAFFLQKLPGADAKDSDGWDRVNKLAETLRPEELLELDSTTLLNRLFHDEEVRLLDSRPVTHHVSLDRTRIEDVILSLGWPEIDSILQEFGEVRIDDELSNLSCVFSEEETRALFANKGKDH